MSATGSDWGLEGVIQAIKNLGQVVSFVRGAIQETELSEAARFVAEGVKEMLFSEKELRPLLRELLSVTQGAEQFMVVWTLVLMNDPSAKGYIKDDVDVASARDRLLRFLGGGWASLSYEQDPVVECLIALEKAIVNKESPTDKSALNRLLGLGSQIIPALIETFRGDNGMRALAASLALREFGVAAVPALTTALSDTHPFVRIRAVTTLGMIGPSAKDAVPALRGMLRDSSANVREAAEGAMKQILAQESA